jgi:hypothetical protein
MADDEQSDDASFGGHGSLRDMLGELQFPADFFDLGDVLPAFLDNVFVLNSKIKDDRAGTVAFDLSLVFMGELAFNIPGLDGVKLAIGGGLPDLSNVVEPNDPNVDDQDPTPEGLCDDMDPLPNLQGMTFLNVELTVSPSPSLQFKDVTVALRFDPDVLAPAQDGDGPVEISTHGSFTIDRTFEVQVSGFDAFNLSPCLIGTSGIGISASGVELDLLRTSSPPAVIAAGFDASFLGVFIGNASLTLPAGMLGSSPEQIILTNAAIGSGGVSGTAALAHEDPVFDSTNKVYTGDRATTLFGVPFWLSDLSLTLKANAFVNATVNGEIVMPFFQERLKVQVGFDGNGGLLLQIASAPNNPALVSFTPVTGVTFQVLSLAVSEQDGKGLFKLNTKLVLSNVGGIGNWPSPEVDGLLIDSDGNLKIEGGWIDLPKQASLDIDGFKMELTKIGFGKEDDASGGHRWFGFSGALKLVDGIKAGASVKGLRITLTEPPDFSLDGVGVDFEIPGSLSVTGSVSMVKNGSGGRDFAGALKITVTPITLTVDGQFLSGKNPTTNNRYFGIFLQGDLPTGIPLGATGLAIYGMAGLYGQGLAPNKTSTEDWYENPDATPGWYKRTPTGITSLADKWAPTDGAYVFGVGVTLGTYSDNGYEFSGSLLLVLSFPGPTILIDGRANLFKKRAALSGGDPTFRALAVIQPNVSFLLGLDAHYKYKDSGQLVDIKGSAEAFFDFTNADNWHIYLGRKDPKLNARIAAKLFKLFDVNGYFELTPPMFQMGAAFSFDKKYGFSSLNVHVQASMQADATVSWHPNHFSGDVILDGSAQLQAFGHGVGVKAHADITGDVFDPFHLHGDFSVGIDLPWPLPDIGASISLDWQTKLDAPPELPLPLREVAVEHTKRMLKWPVPRDPNGGVNGGLLPNYDNSGGNLEFVAGQTLPPVPGNEQVIPTLTPRVPADSKVGLDFSRPISDNAQIGINSTNVQKELVGDVGTGKGAYHVLYQLSSVTLEKLAPAPATADPSDLNPRWVQVSAAHGPNDLPGVPQLFGAWAPAPPNASEPTVNSEQLKLLVNAKTPFDYTAQQLRVYDDWFDPNNPGYPCQPLGDPNQKFCANFVDRQFLPPEGQEVDFTNPEFRVAWPEAAELIDSDTEVPGGNGSHKSLGTLGTLDPDNAVQVTPAPGQSQVQIHVGTVGGIPNLTKVFPSQIPPPHPGNVLSLDTVDLSVFVTSDPNADLNPGPSPTKTPGTIVIGSDGGLATGDLTEITFAPATAALSVDVDIKVDFRIGDPDSGGNPNVAELITFTDDGARTVQQLSQGTQSFRIRQPPAKVVRVTTRATGTAVITLYRANSRTPVSAVGFATGSGDQFGPFAEVDGVVTVVGDSLGLIKLGTPRRCEFTILELCVPDRVAQLNRNTAQSLDLLTEEDPIFDPQSDYRMVVTTYRNDMTDTGNADAAKVKNDTKLVEQAYFHVVGPPGIEAPDRPVTDPPSVDPGGKTGFEDLGFYVASTVPDSTPASDGKPVVPRAFYRSYDVAIYFNEPSAVEQMYRLARRDLTLRLFDTANNPVLDAGGRPIVPISRWDTAQQPTLTDAQQRWVGRVNAASCHPSDIPKFDVTDALTNQNLSAPAEVVLLPETLYQARLVPALLHEAFINAIPNLVADGQHQLERWFADNSVTAQPGRWIVGSDQVLDPSGNPEIGPDGKPVLTFFATETTGNASALIYRGPLGAPEDSDSPDQWTDYRASAQFRWSAGSLIFSVRRVSPGNQIFILLDRTSGVRSVVAVINGTQHALTADQPGFGGPSDDLQLSVDCVGSQLHITQTGVAALDLTLPDGASTKGTVSCLATGAAGCRFTEIRVDDLRANPATAQRFDYITSKYANFAHHLAGFDDQVFEVPASQGITADDVNTNLPVSLVVEAGGFLGLGLPPPSDDETRAFDALELATLGADGRLRAPENIEISNATHDPTLTALLIRSPEPIQWERTNLSSNLPPAVNLGIPGDVKLTGVSFGSTPPEESVTMVVRTSRSLTGFEIQWRHVVDANNPDPAWTTYYTFGAEPVFSDGLGVSVFSGSSADAPTREPGTRQRFVAADATSAVVAFPTDLSGVELRLRDAAGVVVHQREFKLDTGFSQQTQVSVIRKADGTALFLFLPQESSRPPGMRLDFFFTRNPGTGTSSPPFPTLRQAGSDTPEQASLSFSLSSTV